MMSLWTEIRTIISQHPNSNDLLLSVIDKNGNLYYVNSEMRKVLDNHNGKKKVENLFDHVSPDRRDDFKLSMLQSEKTGYRSVADLTVKNGHDHELNLQIHPMEDSSLQKRLFFCIGKEIKSNLKKECSADSINLPGILYKSMLKQIPQMAWAIDEDENLVFANDSFLTYFNLTEKDFDRKMADLVSEKTIAALYVKHAEVLNTGMEIQTNHRVEMADGTNITFLITIFPVEAANGKKIVGGHATMLDSQNLEKQLKEAHDRILLLSRTTRDAIWEWDMKTGRILRNDALMKMIGYSVNESKGIVWWLRRIHSEDRARIAIKVKNATGQWLPSWEDEYRIKCADGEYKLIHDHGYVVYENGLPVKMIGSLHDISEIHSLRNELHEERLKRQQELTETVLQVQEMERTRIGYELHDNINQIISTAVLFIDMFAPSDKEQEKLKQKSVDYLQMAIEDIRKLSKDLAAPQLKEKGLVESIRVLIDDINLAGKVNIKFVHDGNTRLLTSAKKVTMFRIVQEQLKNILKYSGALNADISLHCDANIVKLIIKDNGVGFDSTQTRRGIGLSNIYERTRLYNGKVEINTSPGKGCTLAIEIPHD